MELKDIDIKMVGLEIAAKSMAMAKEKSQPGVVKDYAFNFMIDLKLMKKQKLAVVNIYVEVKDNSGAKLADLTTLSAFEFPDFDNVFTLKEDNRYDLPFDLEVYLKELAVSATRGILYSEFRGTHLHNVIMPLLDLRSIIQIDRKKQLSTQTE